MLAHQEVVQDQRYRRVLIAVVLVVTTAVLSFGIGRTTAETTSVARPVIVERPVPRLGPMSRSDRTRYEVYRKLNRIGPLQPGG
jgi:hypothetical protein